MTVLTSLPCLQKIQEIPKCISNHIGIGQNQNPIQCFQILKSGSYFAVILISQLFKSAVDIWFDLVMNPD